MLKEVSDRSSISHSPEKNPYKRKPGDATVMKINAMTVHARPHKQRAIQPSSSDMLCQAGTAAVVIGLPPLWRCCLLLSHVITIKTSFLGFTGMFQGILLLG